MASSFSPLIICIHFLFEILSKVVCNCLILFFKVVLCNLWCDTPAVNLNHRGTGGSTVHSINIEIHATVASLTWDTQLIVCDITTLVPTPTDSFSCLCTQSRAKLLSSKLSTKVPHPDLAFMQWVRSPKSEHGNSLSSQQQRITPETLQLHWDFDF